MIECMKKILLFYSIPIMIQLISIPIWLVDINYRYVDVSIINIVLCLLLPFYLVLINGMLKGYKQGLIKIHIIMLINILLCLFLGYLGWSKLNIERIYNPDPMTAALEIFFIQYGIVIVVISFVVSSIIKLVKKKRGENNIIK